MRYLRVSLNCFLVSILLWTSTSVGNAAPQQLGASFSSQEKAMIEWYYHVITKLQSHPVFAARSARAAAQDGRMALAFMLTSQFGYVYQMAAAKGKDASASKPMELVHHNGVEVFRPAYGELNVVIRRNQLHEQLSSFASVALRTYIVSGNRSESDRYAEDVRLLQNGDFDYRAMLQSDRISSGAEHAPATDQLQQQLYSHYLQSDGKLLLNSEEQQAFAYLLMFYDKSGLPIGYMTDKLPLMKEKLVTNPTIVALMYHHFSPKEKDLNSVIVHPDRFREQLQMLKDNGYTPIRQQDLLAFMKGGNDVRLPERSVLITIDDGYESNYEFAYPAIVEEQFFATIFATTVNINKDIEYLPRLTWPQSREMVQSGRILVQSHTHESHYYGQAKGGKEAAATVSPLMMDGRLETVEQYKERMHRDLLQAKSLLEEQLHTKVFSFAYPYGRNNNRLIELLRETGHEVMYTVEKGVIRKGMNLAKLPRINVDGSFSAERLLKEINKYIQ